jgi:hypothetical protein
MSPRPQITRRVDMLESELAELRAHQLLLAEAFRRLVGEPATWPSRPSRPQLHLIRGSESQAAR